MASAEVRMPRFDPAMQEGKVVSWLKGEGEAVREGEVIALLEGEKSTLELRSPASGRLRIRAEQGAVVKVGELLAVVEAEQQEVLASPMAKRLAREHNIDLTKVRGTGPGGRITAEDVLREVKGLAPTPGEEKPFKSYKLEGLRRAIAERLSYAHRTTVPTPISMEVGAERLLELSQTSRLSLTALIARACARALLEHKELNCTLEEDEIRQHGAVNIAIAVHTPRGLLAPVLRNAHTLRAQELHEAVEALIARAREGTLRPEETLGHTFTISNLGSEGVDYFAPVLNPPACAILGVGAIKPRPVALGQEVIVKPSFTLTLVFDHRAVDGVPASRFLARVKELLERPEELLGP